MRDGHGHKTRRAPGWPGPFRKGKESMEALWTEINQCARELTPHVNVLDDETRDAFWSDFSSAHARYRAGEIRQGEFRAIVRELKRDAIGSRPVESAPRVAVGDGRTLTERFVYSITGAACIAVLVWVALLIAGVTGTSPDAPERPSGVSAELHDRSMITRGAYWSWQAADGCAEGPVTCDRVLREVNADASAYGLRVYEDGSVTPR